MVSFNCTFTQPRLYDGTVPTNAGQNWQFNAETCTYVGTTTGEIYAPKTNIASTSDIQLYGSFTAGEVIIALMSFVLITIELTKMLMRGLDRIKTKKQYLGYSNAEVEVKEEL